MVGWRVLFYIRTGGSRMESCSISGLEVAGWRVLFNNRTGGSRIESIVLYQDWR